MADDCNLQSSFIHIVEAFDGHDDYLVCGHRSPDGDCMGSALGMTHLLHAMGKHAQPIYVSTEMLDEPFLHMPGADCLIPASQAGPSPSFIMVDASDKGRLGDDAEALFEAASFTAVIDHHEADACIADICHIDSDAPSATCLVWELARAAGLAQDADLAACCYTGLMTDTGRFQYQNADERAFRLAAEMVATGIDVSRIAQDFYQSKTLASCQLESLVVERLELLAHDRIAFSWVCEDDLHRFEGTWADCEGLIDVLRSLRMVDIACVLKDHGSEVRGSLRSKDGTDVATIARGFGGGGHAAAAGFTLTCPLPEAIAQVKDVLVRTLMSKMDS